MFFHGEVIFMKQCLQGTCHFQLLMFVPVKCLRHVSVNVILSESSSENSIEKDHFSTLCGWVRHTIKYKLTQSGQKENIIVFGVFITTTIKCYMHNSYHVALSVAMSTGLCEDIKWLIFLETKSLNTILLLKNQIALFFFPSYKLFEFPTL